MRPARINRQAIIDAALKILETGGAQALTIPALALKLKVRPPSLYNHIESVWDLKRELSIRSMNLMCERMAQSIVGKARDEAVMASARAYRQFAGEHPALYALSVSVPPANDREWYQAFSQFLKLWMLVLEGYSLDRLHARCVARAFRSAVHGFVDFEVNGGWFEDIDVDRSFEEIIHVILKGLRSEEPKPKPARARGAARTRRN